MAPASRQSVTIIRWPSLGCTVNATPVRIHTTPQPAFCLRSPDLPPIVARGTVEVSGPSAAPFATREFRIRHPAIFTLQALLEDAASRHPLGFSVTNAVTLAVQ